MTVKRDVILAWLDERDWPHDPHAQTKDQNLALREALGICGARTKRTKLPCGQETWPARCKWHGGKSLKGIAAPNFQDKGYSRYVPAQLEPAVTAFLESGDPLDLAQAIGTWEGRIDQLLRSLDDGAHPEETWEELGIHWAGIWEATVAGDADKIKLHRQAIDELVISGITRAETWRLIREADETRRRLVDTEDKKRDRRRGYITAEQDRYKYHALRMAVVEGIQMIEDTELQREVRAFIAERFIQIVGPAALPGSTPTD
jgi:hypothetical protein